MHSKPENCAKLNNFLSHAFLQLLIPDHISLLIAMPPVNGSPILSLAWMLSKIYGNSSRETFRSLRLSSVRVDSLQHHVPQAAYSHSAKNCLTLPTLNANMNSCSLYENSTFRYWPRNLGSCHHRLTPCRAAAPTFGAFAGSAHPVRAQLPGGCYTCSPVVYPV